MYTTQIIEYLIWPAFILVAWFSVKFALTAYENRFPEKKSLDSEHSVGE